ncbi:hypothetical protein BC332_04301 [Capsicum chinense]|nr:hypothetical protein BC332_04301 [Capsicum chinense]
MKRGTVLISSGRSVQEQEDSEQLQQNDISNTEPRDEDGDVDASLLSATKLQDSAGKKKTGSCVLLYLRCLRDCAVTHKPV